jgi:hypothetical protein
MTLLESQQPQETFQQAGQIASAMGIARVNNPYLAGRARMSWDDGHRAAEHEAARQARIIQIHSSLAGQKRAGSAMRKEPGRSLWELKMVTPHRTASGQQRGGESLTDTSGKAGSGPQWSGH